MKDRFFVTDGPQKKAVLFDPSEEMVARWLAQGWREVS